MVNSWGGVRAGAGRPKGSKSIMGQRKQRQLRAHDDEWALIKRFDKLIKAGNLEVCTKAVEELEKELSDADINN